MSTTCMLCGAERPGSVKHCPKCGAASASLARPAIEPFVVDGRYRLDRELGRGAMGVVYLATDQFLDRRVAVKILSAEIAADAGRVAAFKAEAKALASLRHENVVQIYTFGPHEGTWFLVLEYIGGPSLEALLEEHEREREHLVMHTVLSILHKTLRGLSAVHAAGIVHRDIKPANIVIEEDTGRPVLVDFGIAASETGDLHAGIVGSPGFMAPEQITRPIGLSPYTPETDIYALGCTAYELLAGRPPFYGETVADLLRRHLLEEPPPVSSHRPEVAPFDEVIARAMAKEPADRYASCAELAAALRHAAKYYDALHAHKHKPKRKATASKALQVLVVGDDPAFGKLASRAVQLAFFRTAIRVKTALSASEALLRAEQRRPQLVLLDHDMIGLNGLDLLSRLRDLDGGAAARVVVVSGTANAAQRYRFAALGVKDFLAKPVMMEDLVATIYAIGRRSGWVAKEQDECLSGR